MLTIRSVKRKVLLLQRSRLVRLQNDFKNGVFPFIQFTTTSAAPIDRSSCERSADLKRRYRATGLPNLEDRLSNVLTVSTLPGLEGALKLLMETGMDNPNTNRKVIALDVEWSPPMHTGGGRGILGVLKLSTETVTAVIDLHGVLGNPRSRTGAFQWR